jgi:hypothetical protein
MANNVYDTFNEFFKQQVRNFKEASVPAKVLRLAVIDAAGEVKKRIQNKGLKSDGTAMDPYSTKPFARPSGIRGTGKVKKYPGGYKEFRESKKKQTAHRDLTLSDDMFKAWRPLPVDQQSWGVGFTSPKMGERANFQESGSRGAQGPIFAQTTKEEQDTLKVINDEAIRFLSR